MNILRSEIDNRLSSCQNYRRIKFKGLQEARRLNKNKSTLEHIIIIKRDDLKS